MIVVLAAVAGWCSGGEVPAGFPRFVIEGDAAPDGEALRRLFWLHYSALKPGERLAALYDEWLVEPTVWVGGELVEHWKKELLERNVTEEGYVASNMHYSMAHPLGWPLPPGYWGGGGFAWHFSFRGAVPPPYRSNELAKREEFLLSGFQDAGDDPDGWRLRISNESPTVVSPVRRIVAKQAPFALVIWRGKDLGACRAFVEWNTEERPEWDGRRAYFEPVDITDDRAHIHHEGRDVRLGPIRFGTVAYEAVPLYRHPEWKGTIRQIRFGLENARFGGEVTLGGLVSSFDTRHNVNNASFVHAGVELYRWTGDEAFLKVMLPKLRRAVSFMDEELGGRENGCIVTPWVGHDGRSGLERGADGKAKARPGGGIGSNYWDLLPFGGRDAYATIRYYDALRQLASVETDGARAAELEKRAEAVKERGNQVFWNEKTGRFVACFDADGVGHDYGYTFVNLEAVYYGFATEAHARAIMDWMDGRRVVEGDTSQGADIYRWRFGPRASTLRNTNWYTFWWSRANETPFGGQVQDGGAVLAFAYHDLMARLKVLGAENAAGRLGEIAKWFVEVERAGGYRRYYTKEHAERGTLQGGGTAGGLGLDEEFRESVLVTLAVVKGFLGMEAGEKLTIAPKLPEGWRSLGVNDVVYRGRTFDVRAMGNEIELMHHGLAGRVDVDAPGGWTVRQRP